MPVRPLGAPRVAPAAAKKAERAVVSTLVTRELTLKLDRSGRTPEATLELPPGVVSLQLTAVGDPRFTYVIDHLEGPQGQVLIAHQPPGVSQQDADFDPTYGPFLSPNRVLASIIDGAATALAPNAPDTAVCPGTWKARASGFRIDGEKLIPADGKIRLIATMKCAPSPPKRGRLDLNIHLTGAGGLSAANARQSPMLTQALAELRKTFAAAGIDIGPVKFHDAPSTFREVDALDPKSAGAMFASTKARGLNLFMVDRLLMGDPMARGPQGMSAGLPGHAQPGTVASGVAVCVGSSHLGVTLAHEISHFLGLPHTSEENHVSPDGIHDAFTDTPIGWGAQKNVMFWLPRHLSVELTPQQGAVMLRHPLVQVTE